ncbi:hypothetical protein [Saccharothrix australiensis]|uniref:hypothetical protein n=1 Tax=Saccharothrix australiensis TaxID=2072 RepID=UPI001B85CCB1
MIAASTPFIHYRDRVVALIRAPRVETPGAGEDVVGPPAEQEGVGTPEDPADERLGLVVEQRQGPPAEPLYHPVERDVRDGRQLRRLFLS